VSTRQARSVLPAYVRGYFHIEAPYYDLFIHFNISEPLKYSPTHLLVSIIVLVASTTITLQFLTLEHVMLLLLILFPLVLHSFASLCLAQYTCVSSGHVVTSDLPSCDYLNNTYTSCNNLTGNDLDNCICTEQLLSTIFELVYSPLFTFELR
jgi:hypothetical protein